MIAALAPCPPVASDHFLTLIACPDRLPASPANPRHQPLSGHHFPTIYLSLLAGAAGLIWVIMGLLG